MTTYDFDLFTIGAGSGGVRASRMAAAYGARVAVAEASLLGGTCVNRGCVPKKLMVHAAEFSAAAADARGYGWTLPPPTFNWSSLIAGKDREIERINGVYRRLLETPGARIIEGRARLIDSHTVEVAGERFTTENILLAIGGHPVKSSIPGHELSITSDEIFHLERLPERIVIAGGGYVAVEFASIFKGLGSEVTLVHRGPLFLRGFDDDVRATLADAMSKRGIDLRFETVIESIEKHGSKLTATTNRGETLEADQVLSAIGRAPNTSGLGLEQIGVELDERGAVLVGEYLQSTVPNIFAVGDCVDRFALTPVAITEGMAIAETLFNNNPTRVDYENVPTAVFSLPSVGAVGLTEAEARAQGREVAIYRSTFRPISNALAGRDERTMVKLVVDRDSNLVLGAHMVGADAGEIVQGLAVALKAGATKATFDATIAIHPTVAEEFVTMRKPVQD